MATWTPSPNFLPGETDVGTDLTDTHRMTGSVSITGSLTLNGSAISAGGTSPGGSDTQVQFNDGGSFGGDSDMVWNKTTNVLTVNGTVNANIVYSNVNTGNTQPASGSTQVPASDNNIFDYQLENAVQLTASAPVHGASYVIYFRQDGTGNHVLTFDPDTFKFPGGTPPTVTAAPGSVDVLTGIGMPDGAGGSTIVIFADMTKNFG